MNEKDAADINAFFGRPMLIPAEFKSWMVDQFALEVPNIPLSSLVGGRAVERILDVNTDVVSVTGDTPATIYTLPLAGKTIAKNGRLRVDLGVTMQDAAGTHTANLNLKVDGSTVATVPYRAFFSTPDPMRAGVIIWNRDSYTSNVVEMYTSNVIKVISFQSLDLSTDHTLTFEVDWISGDADDVYVKKSAVTTVFNPEPA